MLSTGAAPCQQTELQHSPSPTKPDSDAAAAAVANSIINDTPETIKVQQDDCVDVVVNIDSQSSSSNFHTKIREALEAIHCCSYCIYRFTHDASEAQLEGNNIDLDSLQSVISDSCCPCCIGILSHSPAQVTAQITELHESSAYQGVSAFNLGVRFPPHLSMRTRATRLYLYVTKKRRLSSPIFSLHSIYLVKIISEYPWINFQNQSS